MDRKKIPADEMNCRRDAGLRVADVSGDTDDHLVARFGLSEVRDERVAVIVPPPSDLRVICERWPITPWELSSC